MKLATPLFGAPISAGGVAFKPGSPLGDAQRSPRVTVSPLGLSPPKFNTTGAAIEKNCGSRSSGGFDRPPMGPGQPPPSSGCGPSTGAEVSRRNAAGGRDGATPAAEGGTGGAALAQQPTGQWQLQGGGQRQGLRHRGSAAAALPPPTFPGGGGGWQSPSEQQQLGLGLQHVSLVPELGRARQRLTGVQQVESTIAEVRPPVHCFLSSHLLLSVATALRFALRWCGCVCFPLIASVVTRPAAVGLHVPQDVLMVAE